MEELINQRVKKIQISGIRKFYNETSKYKDVISLTLGQPDFHTPEHVKAAGIKAINDNKTVYTHNAGLIELRCAASNYIKNKYNLYYNPENEIIVTNGASEAIDTAFRTILEEGCEVILPGPVYPGYEPIITLCGAVPVYVDTRDTGFKITPDRLINAITPKTRCVVLPYPSNPTGAVLNKSEIESLAKVLKDKKIFVLSDEIYSELNYAGGHTSIACCDGLRDKTIVVNGLSKSHSMTGWRLGLLMGPENIIKHMLKVHQYNTTCASSISQYAALEAYKNGENDPYPMKQEYIKRRDYCIKRLKRIKIDVVKPDGAFYVFPSIKKFGMTSFDFAINLLKSKKVAVVPGSAFSDYGEGFIRISYACSIDTLKEAFDRIEKFINDISK